MTLDDFFKFVGRLGLSRDKSRQFGNTLKSAGISLNPEVVLGYYLLASFVFGLVLWYALDWWPGFFSDFYYFTNTFLPVYSTHATLILLLIVSEIVSFFTLGVILYVIVSLSIERRRNAVEAVLPDFLMLVSANTKAGMTLDQAIWYAAKPEFGLLSEEIKRVIKKSFGGQSLGSCLDELSESFQSKIFERTLLLLKQALATGGEVAEILDKTSEDARDTLILRKEISSALSMYEIFILFAAILGTPFLFGVSGKLIGILEKSFAQIPSTATAATQQVGGFIQPSATPIITSSQFFIFTLATIFVTSLFCSLIIGIVRNGSKNQGFKYFPFILILSVIMYFIVSAVLDTFFSNMNILI